MEVYRDIIIDSSRYCPHSKGLVIYAYVIISNHIHLLTKSQNDNLSDVLSDFKRHTNKKTVETIKQTGENK